MSERTRRQPAAGKNAAKKMGALEALKAARDGTAKRADAYEVYQEEAVYDEVPAEEYAQLVNKRRMEGGSFVVDDDGMGYDDAGEEDFNRDGDGEDGEDGEGRNGGEGEGKRKGSAGGAAAGKKRKSEGAEGAGKGAQKGGGAAGQGGIQKLWKHATAHAALHAPRPSTAKPNNESSEDFLASLLGDMDASAAKVSTPGTALTRPAGPSTTPNHLGRRWSPGVRGLQCVLAAGGDVLRGIRSGTERQGLCGGARRSCRACLVTRGKGLSHSSAPLPLSSGLSRTSVQPTSVQRSLKPGDAGGDGAGYGAPYVPPHNTDESYDHAHDSDQPMEDAPAEAAAATSAAEDPVPNHILDLDPAQQPAAKGAAASVAAAAAHTPPLARDPTNRMFAESHSAFVPTPPGTPLGAGQEGWLQGNDWASGDASAPDRLPDAGATPGGQVPTTPSPAGTPYGGTGRNTPLQLDANGSFPFYFLDAYENSEVRPGEVYLFGKARDPSISTQTSTPGVPSSPWHSCTVLVRGLYYSLVVIPRAGQFQDPSGELEVLEAAAAETHPRGSTWSGTCRSPIGPFNPRLDCPKQDASCSAPPPFPNLPPAQGLCGELKQELRDVLLRHGIRNPTIKPVRRSYAFEQPGVPHGEQYVLKVKYPASGPQLPMGLSGSNFSHIFGCNQSMMELLLLKRRIKGPSWLLLQAPTRVAPENQTTWTKLELTLDSPKAVSPEPLSATARRPSPPMVVASLSLKTHLNPATHQHEIASASVVFLREADSDAPMARERLHLLKHFSLMRKMDNQPWPAGFEAMVVAENASSRGKANGGNVVTLLLNEKALLSGLLAKLQALDSDVLVGHNIGAFDLSVLLHRLQHNKVPLWSRVGRMRRTNFPKLSGGGNSFGGGASHGVLSTMAARDAGAEDVPDAAGWLARRQRITLECRWQRSRLWPAGNSKAWINGRPANARQLGELA
ncbi:MAG: hypothetical protein WDW38_001174 [Sanguina aurantia]